MLIIVTKKFVKTCPISRYEIVHMNYHSAKMQSTRYFYLFGIPLVQEPIEISLPQLVQKLGPKILSPCLGGTNFVFVIWATSRVH